jgi:transposase InsO family protein/transposase-like protein
MAVKKSKRRSWTVSEKLEVVQARQRGLTLAEIWALYRAGNRAITQWMKAYEEHGLVGLEQTNNRAVRGMSARVAAAEQVLEQAMHVSAAAPATAVGAGKAQGALYRHGFLGLARETVRKLLRRNGRGPILLGRRRRNKPPQVRSFERANPNELWQTDIMSFMIKGQYRVYLIGFMDDHSRFLVGWGLYRFQTAANVQEVFRAAIEKHGMPKEVLSDNGRQYYTWRGKSQFTQMLLKLGIRHIRSRPYHPQTCGKIESFWRNLFQECLSQLPLSSFEEAKDKVGAYIEYYNFKRPHQGIGQVTPSDRYYQVAGQVKQIVEQNTERVEEAMPPLSDYQPPAYLVGNLGGKELRVVARSAEVSLQDRVMPSGEEAENGKEESSETAKSAGAAGSDPLGSGARQACGDALSGSGGVSGTVLPLDAASPSGGVGVPGSESSGSEAGQERGAGEQDTETPGRTPAASGAGGGGLAQGAQSPAAGQSGGAADHPASSGTSRQAGEAAVVHIG